MHTHIGKTPRKLPDCVPKVFAFPIAAFRIAPGCVRAALAGARAMPGSCVPSAFGVRSEGPSRSARGWGSVAPRLRSERGRVPGRCVPDRARLRSYRARGLRGGARQLRSERVRGAFGESLARDVRSGSRVPDRAFGPADRNRVR